MKDSGGSASKQGARPPRILYVQPCASFGGAERQASISVPRLSTLGFDVLPLVGPSDTIVSWLREIGVDDLVRAPEFPGGWPKPRGLERATLPVRYWRCLRGIERRIERLIRERDIDLIFAAMPFSWVAATALARHLRLPIIWRAGGTEISPAERAVLAVWATLNPPDLLVCCGESVQRTYGPLVRAPSLVIPNGVDTDTFHPDAGDARRYRPPGAGVVIGFAARLVPQKRPEDLLRVAAAISARHPDACFLVAGDGSRRAGYEELARSLDVGARVRFLGYVADMRSFYAACDIFVLPSRSEGCPNVVLESMAMRRAVLASDAPGTREVIRDGRDGLLFPVGDLGAFAAAANRLIEHPSFRRALATRAHDRVLAAFSTDAAARRLASVLTAALELKGEPRSDRRRWSSGASAAPEWVGGSREQSNAAGGGG
jgi:glycosyltransferase involved in cell wall biosynthesis